MKKIILFLSLSFLSIVTFASSQDGNKGYYFYVQLKNKNNSPYSLTEPIAYLSQRAIDRRNYFSIPIDSLDLPVNPSYVNSIKNLGIYVHCRSKWLNGVTILVKDSSIVQQVKSLPFVKKVEFTGITTENQANYNTLIPSKSKISTLDYGVSGRQIRQMNGQCLHDAGFLGEGIEIAVIDAGFKNVDVNPGFAYFRDAGRLLGTKDFVNPYSNIYDEHRHGASVLSTMAGKVENNYLGSAPEASYWLLRSEASDGEYLCEPDFWMSAIEYADSVGVDVATTSLGYYQFDDASMDFTHDDLDGKTARASISANIASKKGILLLVSAGNEGNKSWKKISVPSDAEGVITVGAVKSDSTMASFSSYGYSADGRVKPELCARGEGTILLNTSGIVTSGNGTSFSCPLLAGLSACYLQAAKAKGIEFTLQKLRENMYRSAHLYANPTTHTGYGIPNFEEALDMLNQSSVETPNLSKSIEMFFSQDKTTLFVKILDEKTLSTIVTITDMSGRQLLRQENNCLYFTVNIGNLNSGIYLFHILNSQGNSISKLFIK